LKEFQGCYQTLFEFGTKNTTYKIIL
jgi:hypothetical protein